MELGLKNRVAFVAASSEGLGKSVALELAREGAHLIICGRNPETLKITEAEIKALGARVLSLTGDLSIAKERNRLTEAALKEFGRVDILVTNSGGPPAGKFEAFNDDDWDKAVQQLLGSAVGLIKGFLPGMKERKWGRIIAIISISVKQFVNNLILFNAV